MAFGFEQDEPKAKRARRICVHLGLSVVVLCLDHFRWPQAAH